MQKTRKTLRRPLVIFLIGIILIVLSFAFWYFVVPPVVSLDSFSLSDHGSISISNSSSVILYLGKIVVNEVNTLNSTSRPVDYSMNLSLVVGKAGLINMTVYVRDTRVRSLVSNTTQHDLEFNSTEFNLFANNGTNPMPPWLYKNIYYSIPVSPIDAFTGGTTPYLKIRNLNTNQGTSVPYSYVYTAKFRSSDWIPIIIFIAGVIIAIVYGVALVRRIIGRARGI